MITPKTGSPVHLTLLATIPDKTISDERFLLVVFDDYRIKGEWFEFAEEIKKYLKEEHDIVPAARYSIYCN